MENFYYKIRKLEEEVCLMKAELFCNYQNAKGYVEFLRERGYSVRKISRAEYERRLPLKK